MNIFGSTDGRMDTDITSPSWSLKVILLCPSSTSHSMQVESPRRERERERERERNRERERQREIERKIERETEREIERERK